MKEIVLAAYVGVRSNTPGGVIFCRDLNVPSNRNAQLQEALNALLAGLQSNYWTDDILGARSDGRRRPPRRSGPAHRCSEAPAPR